MFIQQILVLETSPISKKKIGLIIINTIITFVIVLVLICKRYYFSELWKFVNGCTLMTLLKSQLKIYLNFGCILYMEHHFFLHFTPNFGSVYYTKVHITHKPVHAVLTYSMFYNFSMLCPIRISGSLLLIIAASLWVRQQCVNISN